MPRLRLGLLGKGIAQSDVKRIIEPGFEGVDSYDFTEENLVLRELCPKQVGLFEDDQFVIFNIDNIINSRHYHYRTERNGKNADNITKCLAVC